MQAQARLLRITTIYNEGNNMAIIIKNMEMPKCCDDCPIAYDYMCCSITDTKFWGEDDTYPDSSESRMSDCPLTEIYEGRTNNDS